MLSALGRGRAIEGLGEQPPLLFFSIPIGSGWTKSKRGIVGFWTERI
jgi:hypothetical protein